MKVILFFFSFIILGLAWYSLQAGGVVPQTVIKWHWMEDHSINVAMDYRVLGIGFMISLPILLWLFRKRG